MSNYIISITVLSVVSSFISIIAPENMRKYINIISSFAIILIIISPIKKVFLPEDETELNILQNYETNQTDTNKIAAKNLAESISSTLKENWNLNVKRIEVLTNEASAFDVNKVNVFISSSISDISIISKEMTNLYRCKIEIIQGG